MDRLRNLSLPLAFAVVAALGVAAAPPQPPDGVPPHPDPAFLGPVPGGECTYDYPEYEKVAWTEGRYGDKCKRIHFHFGPITVKPGQNDALIEPVDIEKPAYDGYVVRFKPDLVRSIDGSKPATENMHLHHATWLNGVVGEGYGSGPFFAAGEEKTIGNFPDGFGMQVAGTDNWLLLYMVHNAEATTEEVWLRYTIDYVAAEDAEELGIKPIKPIWLDVQKHPIHEDAPGRSSYPVFNVHKGFGSVDPETGHQVCRWPDQNCSRYDAFGNVTPNQGTDLDSEINGTDWTVPADLAGTLVGLGGHLHPGGIRDEVSLLPEGDESREQMIHISDALYWDHDDPSRVGGPPTSWNLSMTATSIQLGWGVKIHEGDQLRINAVQDSELASWYENMGIVVAFVVPDEFDDDVPSVDLRTDKVVSSRGYPRVIESFLPKGPWLDDWRPQPCDPDLTDADGDGVKVLCTRGGPTHPAIEESGNTGSCKPNCPAESLLNAPEGDLVTELHSAGFTYGNADFGVVGVSGIPRLKLGEPAKFYNEDAVARIWHTYTSCEFPCSGPTTVNYPSADGGLGPDDEMAFDSGNIGYGIMTEPTTSQLGGPEPYDEQWVRDGLYWEFTPTRTGLFTFYCRIHPGMRGVFEVVP